MPLCVSYYILKYKNFDIRVSNKLTFFVLNLLKCIYKDDVLYGTQLIIT